MYAMRISKVVAVLLLVRVVSQKPDCLNQEEVFITQPSDVVVTCGSDESAEFRCQHTLGSEVNPVWTINGMFVDSSSRENHDITHNGTLISVNNIELKHNYTVYQCELVNYHSGVPCTYKSTIGHLIIKGCSVPDVQCASHYEYKGPTLSTLKKITTNITKGGSSGYTIYTITYSDFISGEACGIIAIPTSSCENGVCSHVFDIFSTNSSCSTSSNISVRVATKSTGGRTIIQSQPQIIDFINNFIEVSFDKETTSINLKFINQPKHSKKFYLVKYNKKTPAGCKELSVHDVDGYLSNSNFISLELNLNLEDSEILCFLILVHNGTHSVSIEGVYEKQESEFKLAVYTVAATLFILSLNVVVLLVCIYLNHVQVHRNSSKKHIESSYDYGRRIKERKKLIDKSITFFEVHDVTKDCFMIDFARKVYHNYQPMDGYGYHKLSADQKDELDPSLSVIIMDEKKMEPEYSTFCSVVKDKVQVLKGLYIQSKSVHTRLCDGTKFLYCAQSKVITTYCREYEIIVAHRELDFVKEMIPGFRIEWIRYCYFEFTKEAFIKPHQRIIVKKQNGDFVTGPGVRHMIMGAEEDGSKPVEPPNLSKHTKWKCVYVQSRDLNRELFSGTTYLFCAMMNRVSETVYYDLFDVYKSYNMVSFAKDQIPGFRPELGYGYYEFKQEELLEPEKNVVLIDKNGQLFTGPGAQFFCTGGGYELEDIKKKRPPPSLANTEWKHIFIQSHSTKRELHPGSKFLYLEYQTN